MNRRNFLGLTAATVAAPAAVAEIAKHKPENWQERLARLTPEPVEFECITNVKPSDCLDITIQGDGGLSAEALDKLVTQINENAANGGVQIRS